MCINSSKLFEFFLYFFQIFCVFHSYFVQLSFIFPFIFLKFKFNFSKISFLNYFSSPSVLRIASKCPLKSCFIIFRYSTDFQSCRKEFNSCSGNLWQHFWKVSSYKSPLFFYCIKRGHVLYQLRRNSIFTFPSRLFGCLILFHRADLFGL